MTKKDYAKFAEAIVTARCQMQGRTDADTAFGLVVSRLIDVFEADSPRFDVERFARACEITSK